MQPAAFERLWPAAAGPWRAAAAAGPAAAARELASNLDSLLLVLSAREAAALLAAAPALVAAPLGAWREFLDGVGFDAAQQKAMLLSCPEVRALQ